MRSLKEYIARQSRTRRLSGKARRPMREDAGAIGILNLPGLDAASVALPADIDLGERAARMNEFWEKLVDFQHRDVLVFAICAADER